jgi:3-hydroxymyristoyl/3-hydroxydecanoyl-(acyl carrier protein) dehydratase
MDAWRLLKEVHNTGRDSLSATALAPGDSIWFTGHFPEEPILPGIAMVQAVFSAIREDAQARGETLRLLSLRRVRFTSPVRPGARLDIHVTREHQGQDVVYGFKITVEENVVCSGMLAVAEGLTDRKEK